ncbi:MAG: PEP-CTERM sorting domain-containing protein [Planctomycetota bacterium]
MFKFALTAAGLMACTGVASAQSGATLSSSDTSIVSDTIVLNVGDTVDVFMFVDASNETIGAVQLDITESTASVVSVVSGSVDNSANLLAQLRWDTNAGLPSAGDFDAAGDLLVDDIISTSLNSSSGGILGGVAVGFNGGTAVGGDVLFATYTLSADEVGTTILDFAVPQAGGILGAVSGLLDDELSFSGITITVVPEPASLALLAAGAGVAFLRRRSA